MKILAAALIAVFALSPACAGDAGGDQGDAALRQGHLHPATALYETNEALAEAYENGTGRPRDYRVALAHYQVSADAGRPIGQRGVVRMTRYLGPFAWATVGADEAAGDAEVDAEHYEAAAGPLTNAVADGSPTAAVVLASMYEHGIGVRQDVRKAAELYRLAADQLYGPAEFFCSKLAECAMTLGPNGEMAWLRRAAEHGCPAAEALFGMAMIAGGKGLLKDPAGGMALIRRGADAQDTSAKAVLAVFYRTGLPGILNRDKDRAATLAAEAAVDGNPMAAESPGQPVP